jgi:hypothetical protein
MIGSFGSARRVARWAKVSGLVAAAVSLLLCAASFESATPAGAASTAPSITAFAASPNSLTTSNGTVTLSATSANPVTCTLTSNISVVGLPVTPLGAPLVLPNIVQSPLTCTMLSTALVLPLNGSTRALKYKFTFAVTGNGITKKKTITVTVAPGAGQPILTGASRLAANGNAYCAVVSNSQVTNGVDCWGANGSDELGHGPLTGQTGSTPLTVVSALSNHMALMSGVTDIVGVDGQFCAVTNGNVA